jgi:hypothetical protein
MSEKWRRFRGAAVAAAVLVIFAADPACAEQLLRLKFQPGEVRSDQLVQEMNQTLRPAGEAPPVLITTTQTMDIRLKVESVDEQGTASVTQTIERIRISMQSAQGVLMDFDSAAGKEPEGMAKMLTPMLDTMIKKPIRLRLTTRGEVREMKLPQGMLESLNKVGGGGQTGNLFTLDRIKQMSEIAVLPEGPVNPGQTWTRKGTLKTPAVGDQIVESTYRYEGSETRNGKVLEKINLSTVFKMEGDKKEGTIGIKEQQSQGTIFLDREAGRIVNSASTTKMKMEMEVFGQKMTQDMETTVTIKPQPPEEVAANAGSKEQRRQFPSTR